jgi:hypothetical protein
MRKSAPAFFGACAFLLLLAPSASAACQLTYLGCYIDSPQRILPTQTADAFTCLTREYCASLCASIGLPVSGGEFGGQCFCGPSLPSSAVKVPDTECNMACSGDAHATCGGSYRISVSSAICTGPPQPSPCAYNVRTAPAPAPLPCVTLLPTLRSQTSAPVPLKALGLYAMLPCPPPTVPQTLSAACLCRTRSLLWALTRPRCPLLDSDRKPPLAPQTALRSE